MRVFKADNIINHLSGNSCITVRQPHPRALNSGADSVVPAVFPPPAISGRASNAVTQYTYARQMRDYFIDGVPHIRACARCSISSRILGHMKQAQVLARIPRASMNDNSAMERVRAATAVILCRSFVALLFIPKCLAWSQTEEHRPIIDMHLHAFKVAEFGSPRGSWYRRASRDRTSVNHHRDENATCHPAR